MPTLTCSDPSCWMNYNSCSSGKCHVQYISSYRVPATNHQHSKFAYQGSYINILNARNKVILARSESDNFQPEAPLPAKRSSPAWRNWMVGIMLTVILPSFRHKWGSLQALKSKVDMTIETVESVTKVVEELAEQVEKVADEVGDKLPEDTKLKEAMEAVENLAEEAVKEAELAENLIHKVRDVEKELEKTLMQSDMDQEKQESPKTPKES